MRPPTSSRTVGNFRSISPTRKLSMERTEDQVTASDVTRLAPQTAATMRQDRLPNSGTGRASMAPAAPSAGRLLGILGHPVHCSTGRIGRPCAALDAKAPAAWGLPGRGPPGSPPTGPTAAHSDGRGEAAHHDQ